MNMRRSLNGLMIVAMIFCLSACGGGDDGQETENQNSPAFPSSTQQWDAPDYDSYASSSDSADRATKDTPPQDPPAVDPPITADPPPVTDPTPTPDPTPDPTPVPTPTPTPIPTQTPIPTLSGERVKVDGFTYIKPNGWEVVSPVSYPYSTILLELNSVQANNFSIVARYDATPKYTLSGNISSMKSSKQGEVTVLEKIQVGGRDATWVVVEGEKGAGMMVWVPMQGSHENPDAAWSFGLGSNSRNVGNFKRDMRAFVNTIEFEEESIQKADGVTYLRPWGWSVVDPPAGAVLRIEQPEVSEGNGITVYRHENGSRTLAAEVEALKDGNNARTFKQEKVVINGRTATRLYIIDKQIKTITVKFWFPTKGGHETPEEVWVFEATMTTRQDRYYQQVLSDLLYRAEFD